MKVYKRPVPNAQRPSRKQKEVPMRKRLFGCTRQPPGLILGNTTASKAQQPSAMLQMPQSCINDICLKTYDVSSRIKPQQGDLLIVTPRSEVRSNPSGVT